MQRSGNGKDEVLDVPKPDRFEVKEPLSPDPFVNLSKGVLPEARRAWSMVAIGSTIYFVFGLISAAIAVMVTPIRWELDLSNTQMGIILGSWQLTYIFVALPLGLIIDRIGLKRALLLGALLISSSALFRAMAIDFVTMVGAVALFGIGGPIVSIGLPKLVATWFPAGSRVLPTGICVTGSALGAAVALAGAQSVLIPFVGGWRQAYGVLGAIGLAVALVWWIHGADSGHSVNARQESRRESIDAILGVLRSKTVLLIACIGFAGFTLTHGLNNWLPQILEAKDYDPVASGLLATVPRLGGIFSGLAAAHIALRLRSGIRASHAVLVFCGTSLAAVTIFNQLLGLVPALFILGVASTAIMPLMTTLLMDIPEVGGERIGAAAGVYFTVGEIGGFGGPALLGYLLDLTGSFVPGLLAMVALSFATIIPLWMLGRISTHTVRART